MDFIAKYGSSPVDRSTITAKKSGSGNEVDVNLDSQDTVLQVFKTISEAHVGDLTFFRLYSGKVSTGMDLYNTNRITTERIGQIFVLNGKNRTNVNSLFGGDIGAVVKLKDTHVGNTLCSPKFKVTLPEIEYPNPNIHSAIVLKSKGDREMRLTGKLSTTMARTCSSMWPTSTASIPKPTRPIPAADVFRWAWSRTRAPTTPPFTPRAVSAS